MQHYDPATSVVAIQKLGVELRELIAPAARPDYKRIVEVVNDLRLHTSDVRNWAYKHFPESESK
jgi:signal recognition particle subunit SEC65